MDLRRVTMPLALHASCVAWGPRALLILGPSGSGKSSLALALMALGCDLVADDRVELRAEGGRLVARCPSALAGLVEARFLGLLRAEARPEAEVAAVLDLAWTETERLPPRRGVTLGGLALPLLHKPATGDAPAALLQYLKGGRLDPEASPEPAMDPADATDIAPVPAPQGAPDRHAQVGPGRGAGPAAPPEPADGPADPPSETAWPPALAPVVLVTGPSGAGRSTAIDALEDLGFESIDNLPISLLPRLLDPPPARPLALGIDSRNRDFGAEALVRAMDDLASRPGAQLLYLDCDPEVLRRRFSSTRRRHPLVPDGDPAEGIARERAILAPVRARADIVLDTTALSPHELRAAVEGWFALEGGQALAVTVESFSYKRGLPPGLDIVLDCRFLKNPHWDEALRPLDGRDARVAAYVAADPRHGPFLGRLTEMVLELLPAYRAEGRAHLAIGFGCTGGQHRSVALAESLGRALAEAGWQVSKRHRELDRRLAAGKREETT